MVGSGVRDPRIFLIPGTDIENEWSGVDLGGSRSRYEI
jgi:hypothetical protein